MSDFSMELNEDQIQIQKWVTTSPRRSSGRPRMNGTSAKRRRGHHQEAANIGLYSFDFIANCFADPTGLTMAIANEEMSWGDAGIALSIFARRCGRRHLRQRHAEQQAEWIPSASALPMTSSWRRSVCRSPTPARMSPRSRPGRS